MTSDRKQLIRLASGMPTGDPARKAILAGLEKTKTPLVGSRRVGSVRFTLDADLPKGVERSFSRDLIKMIDANMWDYNKHNDAKRMAEWVEQEASKMLRQALQRSGLSEDEADNAMEDAWDGVQDSIGEYLLKSYEEAADQAEDDEPDIAENYRDEKEAIKRVFRAATSPMSQDRKALIRIASGMPVGDEGRRVLLGELQKTSASKRYRIDKQTYVRNNGRHCPFCGYKDTEAVEADQDDMTKWTVMECPNCGAGWVDIFRLDSLDVESEPTVAPEDLKVPPKPGSPMHKEL